MNKGDVSSTATVGLSIVASVFDKANSLATEYMSLITAFGIIAGALLTAWYYWELINQRKRDRALEHKRLKMEFDRHQLDDHEG